jgi:hypothetical protein
MVSATTLEEHRAALTGHCYRMLGSLTEAEDAVQDTMLRAWRSRSRFEGRSSLRTWLQRIATNVCLDALARRRRRSRPAELGPAGSVDDVTFSMPPYSLWLRGPQAVRTWLVGRGCGCRGSRLVPVAANGSPAFAQYRAGGRSPWALVVLELEGDRIVGWTSFLDTATLFPRFSLPPVLISKASE